MFFCIHIRCVCVCVDFDLDSGHPKLAPKKKKIQIIIQCNVMYTQQQQQQPQKNKFRPLVFCTKTNTQTNKRKRIFQNKIILKISRNIIFNVYGNIFSFFCQHENKQTKKNHITTTITYIYSFVCMFMSCHVYK